MKRQARPVTMGAMMAVAFAAALAAGASSGCQRGQPTREPAPPPAPAVPVAASPPAATPAVSINVGDKAALFYVQVASTPEERANGLTGRPTLAADAGILFVFDRDERQTISTRENLLATDIVFIGADRRIVGVISGSRPLGTAPYRVDALSRYVLQIRGGVAAQMGLKLGQTVEFRAIPGI